MSVCLSLQVGACTHECSALRGQTMASDPPELALELIVNCQTWAPEKLFLRSRESF